MESLGINPTYLLTQIINFVILLAILTKLVYKPMLNSLEKRRKKIEEGLALTDKLTKEKEALDSKKRKVILDAQKEARMIVDKAREEGKKQEAEIIKEARAKADEMLKKAGKELENKAKEMEAKATKDAVDMATELTKRLIGDILEGKKQDELLKKKVSEFVSKKRIS